MWLRAQRAHSETCGRSHRVRGLRSAVLRVRLADTCRSSRTTETCADQPSRRAGALPPPARASPAALPASVRSPRGERAALRHAKLPPFSERPRALRTRETAVAAVRPLRARWLHLLARRAGARRREARAVKDRGRRFLASLPPCCHTRQRSLPQIGRSRSQPPAPPAAGLARDQQGPIVEGAAPPGSLAAQGHQIPVAQAQPVVPVGQLVGAPESEEMAR